MARAASAHACTIDLSRFDLQSDAARLRALADENRRLRKLPAELMLEVSALKDRLGKQLTRSAKNRPRHGI